MEDNEDTTTLKMPDNRGKSTNSDAAESYEGGESNYLSSARVVHLLPEESEQPTEAGSEIGQEQQQQVKAPIELSSNSTQVPIEIQPLQGVESPSSPVSLESELSGEDFDLGSRLVQNAYRESENGSPNILPPDREAEIISPVVDFETLDVISNQDIAYAEPDSVVAQDFQRSNITEIHFSESKRSKLITTALPSLQTPGIRESTGQHKRSRTSPLLSISSFPNDIEINVEMKSPNLNMASSNMAHVLIHENIEVQLQQSGKSIKSIETETELMAENVQSPATIRDSSGKSVTSELIYSVADELRLESLKLQSSRNERQKVNC
nr:hypothetical protein HmN_000840900 [Hymenolepis microstoma]